MIGNKLEQSIILAFQKDLTRTHSINELSKILKKSYPLINQKSNFFLREGILKKIDIGRSYQCFLNLESDKAKILMAINESNAIDSFLSDNKDFNQLYFSVVHLCSLHSEKISFVNLVRNEIIFVMKSMDNNTMAQIQEHIVSPKYKILFFNEEIFREEIINNPDLYRYHINIALVWNYLSFLEKMMHRFLAEGFVKKNIMGKVGLPK